MEQTPSPGQHILACCGDMIAFTLRLAGAESGRAYLRTNIGHAATARQAIIREVLERQPRLAEDWFDIPMTPTDDRSFRLVLPLIEPGHFEAKAFFVSTRNPQPHWPEGPNTTVNVHPASYGGANSLYNAFVRQFGQEKQTRSSPTAVQEKILEALDERRFAVVPPSGTFRDLVRELDFIIHRLHCRIILLLPIHPTPTVYGRMGRFGSPYAALDFLDVDPALAEFDKKATPLEQFQELVDGIHARGARLFLDIAINHTGWAAKIHSLHPDWLVRDADGTIRSPGAWGVVWNDLTELNHAQGDLWKYLADVFLTWCRRGVDGFRCDAGYMIPVPAWEFIVATVRREFPDTIFLLEGLGGKLETTTALLNVANLNWAYSELFQNYDRRQIETYLPFAIRESESDGLMMHFAETHDNNRLAARSIPYARLRTALSALCSTRGAFGFANGVEWLAKEKIDIHERTSLNWNSRENQVNEIARLNTLLGVHPAFFGGARLRLVHRGKGDGIALLRHQPAGDQSLLVLANLDDAKSNTVAWSIKDAGVPGSTAALCPGVPVEGLIDLLSENKVSVAMEGDNALVSLAPCEVLCLTSDPKDLNLVRLMEKKAGVLDDPVRHQCLRARALDALVFYRGVRDVADVDADGLADYLAADPRGFCQHLSPESGNVVSWEWPRDLKREVMIPPRHFLLITAPAPFRVQVVDGERILRQEDAMPQADLSCRSGVAKADDRPACAEHSREGRPAGAKRLGEDRFFALLPPFFAPDAPQACEIRFSVYQQGATEHAVGHLLILPLGGQVRVPVALARQDLLDKHQLVLGTNGRGGMMRAGVIWAELRSRYDALLAGNLSAEVPEDRRIMLTRCRAWLIYHGYSQDITVDREQLFVHGDNAGLWRFRVPFGHGQLVVIDICVEMLSGQNAVRLSFVRRPCVVGQDCLADDLPVTLIVRPDIEDRNFHEDTKAFLGPEKTWPAAIHPEERGFIFSPDPNRRLKMITSAGSFQVEPEWQYLVHHPVEA
ncbi:MAG: glycogen debranching enzyme N-terminal domain-containing protein, partial [Verrucomicrobia bacterium]|nr:glycogen debranching enzyme N-terminal domain-containing protein [Verrucomicrobiota bacterium]MBU4290606.1 glycogen debranching enzyme N-terminal domain-containing protein [Verrucomicrobiota bacterium]MBU4428488.1 glycogen debranching enzyme N-terminal domain-containing protein [Verrucomicrobiota bacterium]MCG2679375.1 glycogen debranching enzyme N-terminal domain-containing protein [Kiritimatiellia bacterium]